ncbi:MAG: methyltransferase [Ferruginibacter sp.]|nr:methyltransferase [Ferruginibacter sp.]
MKVCTDACVFGAYIAQYLSTQKINNVLDIGAGTGLLSLMIVQKNNTQIDAVELNEEAYKQAKENCEHQKSISVHHENIINYNSTIKYNFIISNPPFYQGDLISLKKNKNQAKHDEGLTLQQLLQNIKRLIEDNGEFAVLLPYSRVNEFELMANELNFYIKDELLIKQTPKHNYFRGIQIYSSTQIKKSIIELTIKDDQNNYTTAFVALLKDYYLHL